MPERKLTKKERFFSFLNKLFFLTVGPFVAAFAQTFDEAAPGMLQSFLTTIDKLQENAVLPLTPEAPYAAQQTQMQ